MIVMEDTLLKAQINEFVVKFSGFNEVAVMLLLIVIICCNKTIYRVIYCVVNNVSV